jgi:hypothetical protein
LNYQLYDGFIKTFEPKLSQLSAVLLVALIGYSFDDAQRAIEFFNAVLANRTRLGEEACLCIEADIAVMNVRQGLTEEARVQLDAVEEQMLAQGTGEAVVFSKVYKAMAEYRKVGVLSVCLCYQLHHSQTSPDLTCSIMPLSSCPLVRRPPC